MKEKKKKECEKKRRLLEEKGKDEQAERGFWEGEQGGGKMQANK